MSDSPTEVFTQHQTTFQIAEQADRQRYNQLALWRIVWFAVSGLMVWVLFRNGQDAAGGGAVLAGIVVFLYLLRRHQTIRRSLDLNHHRAFINEDEAARLTRKYIRPETGAAFADAAHAYTADLDVFGPHSLFRLLNRTHTHDGTQRLAHWLREPAHPGVVHFRQQAIADLQPALDWRQELEATARLNAQINTSPKPLLAWATAPAPGLPAYLNMLRFVLPLLTLGLIGFWLAGVLPGWMVLASLAVHGLLLRQTAARVGDLSEQTYAIAGALSGFQALFSLAETVPGEANRLRDIRAALQRQKTGDKTQTASAAIGQLARLTENLNFRRNPYFYLFVGIVSLWDVQYLIALERWRQRFGPDLARWFDALAELESLNSLAGFAFAHPDYTMPNLVEADFTLDIEAVAHPLLPPDRSVANSLTVNGSGQTVLITGSNMSGKSTFLRTIGLNVVLAQAGAVVTAQRFVCSPVQVFTSMRTQDSLEESTSSFYAELKRLQTLIERTKTVSDPSSGQAWLESLPTLYFLDEILKGTNSADRHRGAEALIRQLHRTTASGFVSTHDLALGQLADNQADASADFVRNYHFQSDVIAGELVFDYRLRDGVCRSFNASELMRRIGIELDGI
jgi:hypothetical protein